MKLSELQLDEGLAAVAEYLTPGYSKLSPWQQSEVKKQLAVWLAPIMLKLPDSAKAMEVRNDVFQYEFIEAAQAFELKKLRTNAIYDQHADGDLLKRLAPEVVQVSATNLAVLTATALEAVEDLPADVQLATMVQQVGNPLEDIQQVLDNPQLLDAALAKVVDS